MHSIISIMYTILESPIKTRWPGEVLGKQTHAREMSWSIITRERRSFVYFFPSATRYYYPVAIDLSAGLSIYYYVLIRCCSGLWESDPIYTVFFILFFFYICFTLLLLLLFFILFFIIIIKPDNFVEIHRDGVWNEGQENTKPDRQHIIYIHHLYMKYIVYKP